MLYNSKIERASHCIYEMPSSCLMRIKSIYQDLNTAFGKKPFLEKYHLISEIVV